MLIKLKSVLRTNLELLDEEFSDGDRDNLLGQTMGLENERIVDFSKSDLTVKDLAEKNEDLDIVQEEPEDFRSDE